jgi:hypothetical protein
LLLEPAPPPITTTLTDVTPVGATQEKVPGLVNCCWPAATGVIELLAALAGPVPIALVAVTVNVYAVPPDKPDTVIVPEPA